MNRRENRRQAAKEKKAWEKTVGYTLRQSEVDELNRAKAWDSQVTATQPEKSISAYQQAIDKIRERRMIVEAYGKHHNKWDLLLGAGLGVGLGTLVMVGAFAEELAIEYSGLQRFILGSFFTVAFFCFCIFAGLANRREW